VANRETNLEQPTTAPFKQIDTANIDAVPFPVILLDCRNHITYVNKTGSQFLIKFQEEGAIGADFVDVFERISRTSKLNHQKLQDHLEAVQSRCHYLDLTLDTARDKLLRIKQIAGTGALYQDYDFTGHQVEEMLEFMDTNADKLNELSLRMALKIADLRKVSTSNWRELAEVTCMKRR